jgi:cytochrome c-type biogenesis protein CcmH/NrfG
LWTNLGHAYLEAEMYYRAETALAQALSLDSEEATALCTLALTAEALESPEDEVTLQWENCLRYVDPTKPREQELAVMARARLQQLEEEK